MTVLEAFTRCAALAIALASAVSLVHAQGQAPIKVVVPYPPGGVTDITARALVERMATALGQTMIVDNRPGAGSRIGTQGVLQAPADGSTLLFTNISFSTLPLVDASVRFDPVAGFAPVGLAAIYGTALVAKPSLGVVSLQDLVALAKRQPGKLSYGSAGIGSGSHFVGEYFKTLTGSFIVHIPYRSTGAALNDVAGGQIDIAFDASAKQLVDAGKVQALAIIGAQRDPRMPSVPTAAEAGLRGLDFNAWLGLLAPPGTPVETVARLNKAMNAALQDPVVLRQFTGMGLIAQSGPPERLSQQLRNDAKLYRRIVEESRLKFDPP